MACICKLVTVLHRACVTSCCTKLTTLFEESVTQVSPRQADLEGSETTVRFFPRRNGLIVRETEHPLLVLKHELRDDRIGVTEITTYMDGCFYFQTSGFGFVFKTIT